jgi:hypothetical protein
MSAQYTTTRVSLAALDDEAYRVWSESLAPGDRMRKKLAWSYGAAPGGEGAIWQTRVSVPDGPSLPVGGMGFSVRDWAVSGQMVKAGLMGDLAVLPGHRTLGPALGLARAVLQGICEETTFGYGFPNDRAVPVVVRAGCRKLGPILRYAYPLRSEKYLAEQLRSRGKLARVGAPAFDLPRAMWLTLRGMPALHRWRPVQLDVPDRRFDDLWSAAHQDYPLVGNRAAAFLHWRFCQHPWTKYRVLAMIPKQADARIDGYAVLQWDGDALHVRDLFARKACLPALIDLVLHYASSRALRSVSCATLEQGWLGALLRRKGFYARPPGQEFVICANEGALEKVPGLTNPSQWYLTSADEDV